MTLRHFQLANLFLISSIACLILNSTSDLSKRQESSLETCYCNYTLGNAIHFTALLIAMTRITQLVRTCKSLLVIMDECAILTFYFKRFLKRNPIAAIKLHKMHSTARTWHATERFVCYV